MALVWEPHEVLKPPTDEELAAMEPQDVLKLHELYHSAIANSRRDPYRYGWKLPHWKDAEELLGIHAELLVSGGNRCVDALTTYVTNADTSEPVRMDKVWEGMPVMCYDDTTGLVVKGFASAPFTKGFEKMLKIELSSGSSITCTPEHRCYQKAGRLIRAGSLSVGDEIIGLDATTGNSKLTQVVRIEQTEEKQVWDISVDQFGNYLANGVFHKNSGKTSWAAHAVVKAAVENPGSVIMCFAQNADVSIRQQQSAVYDALPEEFKVKVLGTEENVSYTRKNGFSKSSLILPVSKSSIIFKTYAQFLNNDTILEGAELGCRNPSWINIGAWCDEYLVGPELLSTLRFRLATRNSKLVVTFTPIDGYTEVVRDYVQGAETIRSKPAELLGGRSVPYLQRSRNRDAGIIYFHSRDNPFGGYDRIAKDLANRPEAEILTRAYGIATKSISTKFPNFSRDLNVVAHESINLKGTTKYLILDPAGRKNWFMAWIAVDQSDTWWIYREWPDVNVGDWARWHGGKWIGGEGSKGLGYGIRDYVDLITQMEADTNDTIFERLIDPRLGAAKYQTQTGVSSVMADLEDAGLVFLPAPGLDIEDGLQAIQTKLSYNKKAPVDSLNRPHLYISDRCENIIQAFQEYTADGGQDEAWKDPIDCIRYAAVAGIRFIDPNSLRTIKPIGRAY